MSAAILHATGQPAIDNNGNVVTHPKDHPAFFNVSTKHSAESILQGKPPMTYILWTETITEDGITQEHHHLSFIDYGLNVQHRTFSHPSSARWFYRNGDLHRASTFSELIPAMMHSTKCTMLVNPVYDKMYF
jgi:hypothetical protein